MGAVHYCSSSGTLTMRTRTCTDGGVCGWDTTYKDYACVAPPGGADPNHVWPEACP
jgi:LDH2 family malate/lactate/ureidoglycolate dehydrogenase